MKHETLQRVTAMQADIIMMMANLIEGRDGTTGEHVKRASIYVNMLLNRLVEKGISKEELDSVAFPKICIPGRDDTIKIYSVKKGIEAGY